MTTDNIEACHRIGKSKENSRKTIVRFINRKYCEYALVNGKKLKSFNSDGDMYVDALGDAQFSQAIEVL